MEEQEHKISSFIEQQEEFKSTVSSFVCCRLLSPPKSSLLYNRVTAGFPFNYNHPQVDLIWHTTRVRQDTKKPWQEILRLKFILLNVFLLLIVYA